MTFILIGVAALTATADHPEPKLCDPTIYVSQIEPDMQYTEDEFNYENFRWAMDWLKEAKWKTRVEGKTYSKPFELGWEFEMAYFNRLTSIEGYVLKQRAIAATGDAKTEAVDEFCTFLVNAVPLD